MIPSGSSPDDEQLDEEAANWLFESETGFTPERARAFEAWRTCDPRHDAAVRRVRITLAILDELPSVQTRLGVPRKETLPAGRSVAVYRVLLWLGGLAAVFVLGLATWRELQGGGSSPIQHYTTAENIQESVALADGSVMDVDADSEVAVNFTRAERHVTVTRGEAHFQVVHDTTRPFAVTAGGVTVRAVGTAFQVRLTSEAVEVVVVEGKVAWDRGPHLAAKTPTAPPPLIVAGERAQMTRGREDKLPEIHGIDPEEIRALLTWRASMASFTDVPLRDVITRLNRRNPTQLVLADAELGDRKIGGRIALDQVEPFVRLLEQDGDIVADRAVPGRIVLRRAR